VVKHLACRVKQLACRVKQLACRVKTPDCKVRWELTSMDAPSASPCRAFTAAQLPEAGRSVQAKWRWSPSRAHRVHHTAEGSERSAAT
jgi:hypothetical protein